MITKRISSLLILTIVLAITVQGSANDEAEDELLSGSCSVESTSNHESSSSPCGCSLGTSRNALKGAEITSQGRLVLSEEFKHEFREVLPSIMLDIPGGTFVMGTTEIENVLDGEGPPRQVTVSRFSLQQTEVSIAQFAKFVVETGYETDAEKFGWSFCFERTLSPEVLKNISQAVAQVPWWLPVKGANWLFPNGPDQSAYPEKMNHPVTHVSHNDAKTYCEWLGLRLPTEAEFEYAMRGGLENKTYPWGDELLPEGKHRANLWQGHFPNVNSVEDGYEYSSPVDAFGPQNAYELYNIVGNAWEWVADAWITNFSKLDLSKPLVDPQIEIQGKMDKNDTERVKRGGSYMCHKSYCLRYRTASRSSNSADSSAQNLGFRCAE